MKKKLISIITMLIVLVCCVVGFTACQTGRIPGNNTGDTDTSSDLKYVLSYDRTSYIVEGVGMCSENQIEIPATYNNLPVTEIGIEAFKDCRYIVKMTIPSSVTKIAEDAFEGCTSLEEVVINESVTGGLTEIGEGAFNGCTALETVTLPSTLYTIHENAFYGCTSLDYIIIPENTAYIYSGAFDGCEMVILLNTLYEPYGFASDWRGIATFVLFSNQWERGAIGDANIYTVWETVTPATCTSTGLESRICITNEFAEERRIVEKLPHTFVDGVCSVCGYETEVSTVTGSIFQADTDNDTTNNVPIEGATVALEGTDIEGNEVSVTTSTDSFGAYSLSDLPFGTFTITISKDGHIICVQIIVIEIVVIHNEPIILVPEPEIPVAGSISGQALNAVDAQGISGITVNVRSGMSTTTGDIIATTTTGADGAYSITGLQAGNYTLQFVDERTLEDENARFTTGSINVALMSGAQLVDQIITLSNNLGMETDSIRVVLIWGSTPSDLDSHLYIDTDLDGETEYHIYYGDKIISGADANLDVDDTTSYGPETVTIDVKEGAIYNYKVYNYSGGGDTVLSSSGATVKIYVGDDLYRTLYVPSGSGRWWNIFSYDTVSGFTFYNTVTTDSSMS